MLIQNICIRYPGDCWNLHGSDILILTLQVIILSDISDVSSHSSHSHIKVRIQSDGDLINPRPGFTLPRSPYRARLLLGLHAENQKAMISEVFIKCVEFNEEQNCALLLGRFQPVTDHVDQSQSGQMLGMKENFGDHCILSTH